MSDEIGIEVVSLIDAIIRDCIGANLNLPPMPAVIAEVLARTFCKGNSAASHAVMMMELTALVRERAEFLAVTHEVVN